MKLYSYNAELRTATAQMLDVFNDIIIYRYNDAGKQTSVSVPCLYGQSSEILKNEQNRNKTINPPLMALTVNSYSRDAARAHSVNDGLLFGKDSQDIQSILFNTATPININYTLEIVAFFQNDIDGVISNIIPNFNPDIFVVWPNPKDSTKNIKSRIVWDGSVNIQYDNANATQKRLLHATMGFAYHTWMFPGERDNLSLSGTILHIVLDNELSGNIIGGIYDVPRSISFDAYEQSILAGDIVPPNYDTMTIAHDISGLW